VVLVQFQRNQEKKFLTLSGVVCSINYIVVLCMVHAE
jgi:hypothetical protein